MQCLLEHALIFSFKFTKLISVPFHLYLGFYIIHIAFHIHHSTVHITKGLPIPCLQRPLSCLELVMMYLHGVASHLHIPCLNYSACANFILYWISWPKLKNILVISRKNNPILRIFHFCESLMVKHITIVACFQPSQEGLDLTTRHRSIQPL